MSDQPPSANTPKDKGPRYCPMCDEFVKAYECKKCGMKTEKAVAE
jgi:hypothetical protein